MPLEGCAFVCWLLAVCSSVLYWFAWRTGDMQVLIPASVFALAEAALSAYVLAMRYCQG